MKTSFTVNTKKKLAEDEHLWLSLRKGDENAFAKLFEKYHRTLYNYGLKLSGAHPELVEDAIQDLFIDLWRLRGGLTDRVGSVKFYLYRCLRRKLHLLIRTEMSSEIAEPFLVQRLIQASPELEKLLEETENEQKKRLGYLLSQLPDRQLEAITLKYFEDFSIEEIARIMEVNEKSVRNFIYKALVTLRSQKHWLVLSVLVVFGI